MKRIMYKKDSHETKGYDKHEITKERNKDKHILWGKNDHPIKSGLTVQFNRVVDTGHLFKVKNGSRCLAVSAIHSLRKNKLSFNYHHFSDKFYLNVPNSDIHCDFTVGTDRIKSNIMIYSKMETYEFPCKIIMHNLTFEYDGISKGIVFKDKYTFEPVFKIPGTYMYDAYDAYTLDVKYDIKVNGDTLYFTIIADSDWINDEERAFPIMLDPKIMACSY